FTSNLTAVYGAPTTNVNVQAGNIFFLKKDIITPQNRNIIVLGGPGFTSISTPITFRFYAWNAESTSGTFSIDNVDFIGSSVATGITEKSAGSINIFPNPSSTGIVTVDLGFIFNNTIITVYDIVGKIISVKEADAASKQSIDLSAQPNGCYFVSIKNDSGITTKKIILDK
ncbi:MAG: T9SS type A sorting domain-containing protein, partial [Bacteroidia bacterium]